MRNKGYAPRTLTTRASTSTAAEWSEPPWVSPELPGVTADETPTPRPDAAPTATERSEDVPMLKTSGSP